MMVHFITMLDSSTLIASQAPSIHREGRSQRFCQQCGRFHDVGDFDAAKRSCRARLQRHNARRRKRDGEPDPALPGADSAAEGSGAQGGNDVTPAVQPLVPAGNVLLGSGQGAELPPGGPSGPLMLADAVYEKPGDDGEAGR